MVSNLALDPAGPYFENCDVIVRLDHTDAEFVDVIHADTNLIRTMGKFNRFREIVVKLITRVYILWTV